MNTQPDACSLTRLSLVEIASISERTARQYSTASDRFERNYFCLTIVSTRFQNGVSRSNIHKPHLEGYNGTVKTTISLVMSPTHQYKLHIKSTINCTKLQHYSILWKVFNIPKNSLIGIYFYKSTTISFKTLAFLYGHLGPRFVYLWSEKKKLRTGRNSKLSIQSLSRGKSGGVQCREW